MKKFFKELFEYNYYFNTKLTASFLEEQNAMSMRSLKLFCHILNAHEIWNSRILGKANVHGVWDIHNPNDFEEIIQLNQEATNAIIETRAMDEIIRYTKGKRQKKVSDILFHIINHSTYHRGQIAMDFRENGIEPIATDYIHYDKKN